MSQQYIKCPHCGQEIDLKKHLVDDSTKDKLLNEVKEDLKAGELNKDALAKKDLELQLIQARKDIKKMKEIGSTSKSNPKIPGDSQELIIEDYLRKKYPNDEIKEIPDGKKGADIHHIIKNGTEMIGSILYESKNVSKWLNEWKSKLKEDQKKIGADLAVLVTQVLPKEIKHGQLFDDLFIYKLEEFELISGVLVEMVKTKHLEKKLAENRGDNKNQDLVNLVSNQEFKADFNSLIDEAMNRKVDLEKEITAQEKRWGVREKSYKKQITSVRNIYLSLQEILGKQVIYNEKIDDE